MSGSNCCFLTFIQIAQEAGKVVWYSHLFQNFPQFLVIHTVKGFDVVNEAEVAVFLELSCIFYVHWMLAIWSLVPLPFLKPAWTSGSSRFVLLKPGLENFEHYFASIWKWSESEVAQSCPTLWDPVDCSLPGSSVHGILQARILEWVAISFSRGSSRPRDWTPVSHIADRCFNLWATREAPC